MSFESAGSDGVNVYASSSMTSAGSYVPLNRHPDECYGSSACAMPSFADERFAQQHLEMQPDQTVAAPNTTSPTLAWRQGVTASNSSSSSERSRIGEGRPASPKHRRRPAALRFTPLALASLQATANAIANDRSSPIITDGAGEHSPPFSYPQNLPSTASPKGPFAMQHRRAVSHMAERGNSGILFNAAKNSPREVEERIRSFLRSQGPDSASLSNPNVSKTEATSPKRPDHTQLKSFTPSLERQFGKLQSESALDGLFAARDHGQTRREYEQLLPGIRPASRTANAFSSAITPMAVPELHRGFMPDIQQSAANTDPDPIYQMGPTDTLRVTQTPLMPRNDLPLQFSALHQSNDLTGEIAGTSSDPQSGHPPLASERWLPANSTVERPFAASDEATFDSNGFRTVSAGMPEYTHGRRHTWTSAFDRPIISSPQLNGSDMTSEIYPWFRRMPFSSPVSASQMHSPDTGISRSLFAPNYKDSQDFASALPESSSALTGLFSGFPSHSLYSPSSLDAESVSSLASPSQDRHSCNWSDAGEAGSNSHGSTYSSPRETNPSEWWRTLDPEKELQKLLPKTKSKALDKPNANYVTLLRLCILTSPRKRLTLSELYSSLETHWPFFRHVASPASVRNSIRNALSLNQAFRSIPRERDDESGKGGYWMVDENVEPLTIRKKKGSGSRKKVAAKST